MFDRYVRQEHPTDSSHYDDNLFFKLNDNFFHKHLFIQFAES